MITWQLWGDLAFKLAKDEDKPICLIISQDGYWSRVMIKRALRDERVVELLSRLYIPVRVSAEEWPEVSCFALKFLKVSTGRAGWPMVLWLSPDGEPIMGLTSLALEDDAPERFGFVTHLKLIAQHWRDPSWAEVNQIALERIRQLSDLESMRRAGRLSHDEYMIDYAERWILRVDPVWGGFSSPLKFPLPLILSGILGVWNQLGHRQHLHVVEYSLTQLLRGGLYDHVGGGVWRYSFDEHWSSGCYEKLLLDQAHFTLLLSTLYRITGRRIYREALRATAELICEDFTSAEGGFIARIGLEDHDASVIQRGSFHQASWSQSEVRDSLEPQEAEWFIKSFLSPERATQRETGYQGQRYLPRLAYPLDQQEEAYWRSLRPKLLKVRRERDQLDRSLWRICTDNAVASVALARAALLLDRPDWFNKARETMSWLLAHLWDGSRLCRAYQGSSRTTADGALEDYMSVTWALCEFYKYTEDQADIQMAEVDFDSAHELFRDFSNGGFFHASPQRRRLLPIQEKPTLDGIDLSGNAWSIFALQSLSEATSSSFHRDELLELAERFEGSVSCQTSCAVSLVGAFLRESERH